VLTAEQRERLIELRRDFQRMTLHGWRVESQVGDVTTNCRVTNGREVSSAGEKG